MLKALHSPLNLISMKAPTRAFLCFLGRLMTAEQTAEIRWIGGAMQTVPQRVHDAIMPIIDEFEVELVGIEVAQEGRRTILWVYIDREGGSSLDDCAKIAPELSAILVLLTPWSRVMNCGSRRPAWTDR